MVKIEIGNILDTCNTTGRYKCYNEYKYICQQVNCIGVMGGGLAAQIRKIYPDIYEEYRTYLNTFNNKKDALGKVYKFITNDNLVIFNIFGQYSFGTDKKYTDYDALANGFECIKKHLIVANPNFNTLYIPYNIGCGLGGGDWNIVLNIIYNKFGGKECDAVIVKKQQ